MPRSRAWVNLLPDHRMVFGRKREEMTETGLATVIATVVDELLRSGKPVSLDGLGVFRLDSSGRLRFTSEHAPLVFIAYAHEDSNQAIRLADALEAAGLKPWIDKRRLLPGQNWQRAIERAIDRADFFVACFSRTAARKRGQFPCELRSALRCAERMPLDDSFILPVRLEECEIPQRIQATTQHVDLFPDWEAGVRRLIRSIEGEYDNRRLRSAA